MKHIRARPVKQLKNFVKAFFLDDYSANGNTAEESEAKENREDTSDYAQLNKKAEKVVAALHKLELNDYERLLGAFEEKLQEQQVALLPRLELAGSLDSDPSALTGESP